MNNNNTSSELGIAGTPLAQVASGSSSASAIRYVKEDKSYKGGLTLIVTSKGPLIQPRKRIQFL
jgi:hypothetical protein